MTVAPLQLPPIINVPQLDFRGLDTIGDAVAGYRQRSALADSLPSMFGEDGNSINNIGANPPSSAPQSAPQASGLTQDQMALLKGAATRYGLDPNYLITVASKEGTGQNPSSSANGLGQFTAATAKQYGVVPGDAASAADGFARFTLDNAKALTQSLGHPPSPDELALAHQQGAGGATALLSNPNANVIDALTPAYGGDRNKATAAVVNNGGSPQMTAGQFAQKQMAYYGGANLPPNAQPAQYQPQQAPGSPPQPNIPPQVMARIQAMIRAGGPAQQFAMALLQKYVVPQTPVVVNEGGIAVNPVTGAVIARGQPKPVSIPLGGSIGTMTPGGQFKVVGGASGGLSPETIDGLARRYLETGDNQIITDAGNGSAGAVNRAALLNRIEELRAQTGKSGTDVVGAKASTENQIKSVKDFGTGQQGNTVRSLNVAIDHLATLKQYADALSNGDYKLVNTIRNEWQKETGQPLPTNFEAVRPIVTGEIAKAVIGSNNAISDRDELREAVQTSGSPAQLSGAIGAYTALMAGQMRGLRQQYVTNTKKTSDDFNNMLLPRTKTALGALDQEGNGGLQQLPKGVTGAMVVNDAKQAWAGATPQQRSAMQSKAMQYGIDLSKYGLK